MKSSFVMLLAALGIVLTPPNAALAHGGAEHVLGLVKAIDASTLVLEGKDKKEVMVELSASTRFEKSGAVVTREDVKPGLRVSVHAKESNGKLVAELVKIGNSKSRTSDSRP